MNRFRSTMASLRMCNRITFTGVGIRSAEHVCESIRHLGVITPQQQVASGRHLSAIALRGNLDADDYNSVVSELVGIAEVRQKYIEQRISLDLTQLLLSGNEDEELDEDEEEDQSWLSCDNGDR